jgi:DNA-binding MarR family transcriptional regulator
MIGSTNVDIPNERTVMSATSAFTPRLIGETEKTLNAILDRHLAEADLTEQHWITLTLAVISGGSMDRDQLVGKVVSGAKFSEQDVRERVTELVARGLLDDSGGPEVTVTDAGAQLHARIRAANDELTARLWGDLSAGELDTAARVLAAVLERANAELGRA